MVAERWQDLCYGARMILKQKGLTAIAALSLALGEQAPVAFIIFAPVCYAACVLGKESKSNDFFALKKFLQIL